MFNSQVFKSWPSILAGALLFGAMFMIAGAMSELVIDGTARVSRQVQALAGLAFVGYIMVALIIRLFPRPLDQDESL